MNRYIKQSILSVLLLLSLTSCRANWFGETIDVPWWTIAVPVVIIFVVSYVFIYTHTYVCPKCGSKFSPKWYELSALLHFCGARLMKCPNCGKRGYCKGVKK